MHQLRIDWQIPSHQEREKLRILQLEQGLESPLLTRRCNRITMLEISREQEVELQHAPATTPA